MTEPRAMRATCGQPKTARMAITVQMVRWCMTCISTMAASSNGMPKKMSANRDTTASTQPP